MSLLVPEKLDAALRAQQVPGLWRVWARLKLDISLVDYQNVSQSEVEYLEKKLEEKYGCVSVDQLMMLCEN